MGGPDWPRDAGLCTLRSSLHGDEQDFGRYPAYWKFIVDFQEWGGGLLCLLSGWGSAESGADLPGGVNVCLATRSAHRSGEWNQGLTCGAGGRSTQM